MELNIFEVYRLVLFLACQDGEIHVTRLIFLSVQLAFIRNFQSKSQQGDLVTHEFEMQSKKEQYTVTDYQLLMLKPTPFSRHNKVERISIGPHRALLCRVPLGDKTFSRFQKGLSPL